MIDLTQVKAGDTLPAFEKESITKVQLAKYAGASGDYNPLHLDDEFAKEVGMDCVIAHGMLVMGFLGQYEMEIAANQAKLARFNMRFGKMTKPGDIIICHGNVKDKANKEVTIDLFAVKQDEDVVGTGEAVFTLT